MNNNKWNYNYLVIFQIYEVINILKLENHLN